MNKEELMGKSKEELIEKIMKMKDMMKEGGKCACKCEECKKCLGYTHEGMKDSEEKK